MSNIWEAAYNEREMQVMHCWAYGYAKSVPDIKYKELEFELLCEGWRRIGEGHYADIWEKDKYQISVVHDKNGWGTDAVTRAFNGGNIALAVCEAIAMRSGRLTPCDILGRIWDRRLELAGEPRNLLSKWWVKKW